MSDDRDDFDDFDDEDFLGEPLDEHESALVRQDLHDLDSFETAFLAEGYRGVAVYCEDCVDEHYYPWDMIRGNLEMLLETGETPVHEPAFAPDPDEYVPWEYARGYVDALRDAGVGERRAVEACSRCGLELAGDLRQANFCPACGDPLVVGRLVTALRDRGLDDQAVTQVLREIGLPR